ncbi:uncharacterized protein CLUP02_03543 [Colletotrichum lupini]|uniref:Uncharacterized protein n=1 Tax=Colletotrichum lupini TaxID=145971 RepID=A0A9Q8WCA1_9PEZI|nr:uncharacterized protein CLUP02_03543 [Colletotrichum lupini]UQC78069.1 hypothetical protein CLUP02_03543 [Colletotrichum lupini]
MRHVFEWRMGTWSRHGSCAPAWSRPNIVGVSVSRCRKMIDGPLGIVRKIEEDETYRYGALLWIDWSRQLHNGVQSEQRTAGRIFNDGREYSGQGSLAQLGQVQARDRIASTGSSHVVYRKQTQAEPVSCELQNKGPQATPAHKHPTPGTQAGWEAQVPEKLKNDQHKGGKRVGGGGGGVVVEGAKRVKREQNQKGRMTGRIGTTIPSAVFSVLKSCHLLGRPQLTHGLVEMGHRGAEGAVDVSSSSILRVCLLSETDGYNDKFDYTLSHCRIIKGQGGELTERPGVDQRLQASQFLFTHLSPMWMKLGNSILTEPRHIPNLQETPSMFLVKANLIGSARRADFSLEDEGSAGGTLRHNFKMSGSASSPSAGWSCSGTCICLYSYALSTFNGATYQPGHIDYAQWTLHSLSYCSIHNMLLSNTTGYRESGRKFTCKTLAYYVQQIAGSGKSLQTLQQAVLSPADGRKTPGTGRSGQCCDYLGIEQGNSVASVTGKGIVENGNIRLIPSRHAPGGAIWATVRPGYCSIPAPSV